MKNIHVLQSVCRVSIKQYFKKVLLLQVFKLFQEYLGKQVFSHQLSYCLLCDRKATSSKQPNQKVIFTCLILWDRFYISELKIFLQYNGTSSFGCKCVFLSSNEAVNQVCLLIYRTYIPYILTSFCTHNCMYSTFTEQLLIETKILWQSLFGFLLCVCFLLLVVVFFDFWFLVLSQRQFEFKCPRIRQ